MKEFVVRYLPVSSNVWEKTKVRVERKKDSDKDWIVSSPEFEGFDLIFSVSSDGRDEVSDAVFEMILKAMIIEYFKELQRLGHIREFDFDEGC